jgi:hypothetical protein
MLEGKPRKPGSAESLIRVLTIVLVVIYKAFFLFLFKSLKFPNLL